MNKIIFLDVDGTLINYEAKCPESAKLAINKASKKGHKIYVCTGCSKAEITQRDLPYGILGMIGANGGYVESEGKAIMHKCFSNTQIKEIVDWCNNGQLGFYLEANSGMYINDYFYDQSFKAYQAYSKNKQKEFTEERHQEILKKFTLKNGNDLYRDDVNKISFILSSYQDHLDSKKQFPELVANTWGGKGHQAIFGDLSPSGISKKEAIKVLLNYLNANKEDTISFGDADIDLSMFEVCNYNVAMGNASKRLKEKADYITSDVDDNGLYKAFEYLDLF